MSDEVDDLRRSVAALMQTVARQAERLTLVEAQMALLMRLPAAELPANAEMSKADHRRAWMRDYMARKRRATKESDNGNPSSQGQ